MSDSVPPRRRQPTRLLCPWDSPGKNTGVGCHFLLQCMKVKVKSLSCVRLLVTPRTAAYQASPSMGFSRQEYWSEVPLPSPIRPYRYCYPSELQYPLCASHTSILALRPTHKVHALLRPLHQLPPRMFFPRSCKSHSLTLFD